MEKLIHVFDFDGTIANTEPLHWKTHQQLLSDYGVTLTEQHIYILSSQAKFVIEQLLTEWNLLQYFKSIISLEDSNESKLDIIRTIEKKENIIWFEDNTPLVNKAQRLGYNMILVKTI